MLKMSAPRPTLASSDATLGAVYGILAASIWGGMYIVSDIVLETIPPFSLLVIRLVMGMIVLWVWRVRQMPLPARTDLLRLLGVGMVGFGVSVGAQFVGTDYSTAVNGALITSASPAFILAFAVPVLGERLTGRGIVAVALATVGVLVIVDLRQANFSSDTFVGDMALALAL
jgi:drug/metabolite transporter (DMT)-like permease